MVQVPENHAKPRGRKISLHVMVLPATGERDGRRAQYDLEGGPGFAVTDFLEFYAGEGAAYREHRDIVLADMRGTGGSSPLRCPAIEELQKREPVSPMYPPALVAECARQLGAAHDLRQYTTAAASRDIDLVRRALGYEQIDINALSYGTTLALRYIADYPKAVHAAALMGTVPARRTPPRFHSAAAGASLDQLDAECAADAGCRKFGSIEANLIGALVEANKGGAISPDVFLEKLRGRLYSPASRAQVPYLLALAAHGDFGAFTRPMGEGRVFADGLYLSITCAESFAQINADTAIIDARRTRFGPYRLERQRDACAEWPKGIVDPQLMQESKSEVPVLFIAGDLDPVAPAEWAFQIAPLYSRGKLVRVPHGAHVMDGLTGLDTCLDASIITFFEKAAIQDISCFSQMMPPPFKVSSD